MSDRKKLEKSVATLEKDIKTLERKSKDLKLYNGNIIKDIKKVKDEQKEVVTEINELHDVLANKKKEIALIAKKDESNLKFVKEDIVKSKSEHDSVVKDIKRLEEEKINLEESISYKLKKLDTDKAEKKKDAEVELNQVHDERLRVLNSISSLEINVEQLRIKISKLTHNIQYREEQLQVLEANIEDQKNKYITSSSELKKILDRTDEGLRNYAPLAENIKVLREAKQELDAEIEASQDEIEDIEKVKKNNEYQSKSIQERNIELKVKAKGLKNKNAFLNKREKELKDAQVKVLQTSNKGENDGNSEN